MRTLCPFQIKQTQTSFMELHWYIVVVSALPSSSIPTCKLHQDVEKLILTLKFESKETSQFTTNTHY